MRIGPRAVWEDVGGKVVVLDQNSGRYFQLNRMGSRVWMLLSAAHDRDEIVQRLATEFSVDQNRVAHDVDALLHQLRTAGLLEDSLD